MKEKRDDRQPVLEIVSQHPPKANPPAATLDSDPRIPHPVVDLGDLVELAHALQRVDARDEHRRPGYELIPRHPDSHTVRGEVVKPNPVFETARRL